MLEVPAIFQILVPPHGAPIVCLRPGCGAMELNMAIQRILVDVLTAAHKAARKALSHQQTEQRVAGLRYFMDGVNEGALEGRDLAALLSIMCRPPPIVKISFKGTSGHVAEPTEVVRARGD